MFDSVTTTPQPEIARQQLRPRLVPTALVVEDHADFRELLILTLKRLGYRVLEAANGKQALNLAQRTRPNLIVTDYGMPEMDGMEFVLRLRRDIARRQDCPVIMLTAYDPQDLPRELEGACEAILSKPVDLDKFESLIESLTASCRPTPQLGPQHRQQSLSQ